MATLDGTRFWVGVEHNPALMCLQRAIEVELRQIGLPPVKLVRLRRRGGLRPFLAENANFRAEPFAVRQFSLIESHLGAHGPIYQHKTVYALQQAERRPGVRKISSMTNLAQLKHSLLYSEELGIDLAADDDDQYFRWFLASLLFGGHISETIARRTYQAFCRHHLTTPRTILDAGWDFLVDPIMREGGYVRYDFSKSHQILRDCRTLVDEYQGSLWRLHETSRDKSDLEARLLAFYGVGPVTANIFLRELRPFWPKADPSPLPIVLTVAASLGIDLSQYRRTTLTFVRIEAGLIRMRREHRGQAALAKAPATGTTVG